MLQYFGDRHIRKLNIDIMLLMIILRLLSSVNCTFLFSYGYRLAPPSYTRILSVDHLTKNETKQTFNTVNSILKNLSTDTDIEKKSLLVSSRFSFCFPYNPFLRRLTLH